MTLYKRMNDHFSMPLEISVSNDESEIKVLNDEVFEFETSIVFERAFPENKTKMLIEWIKQNYEAI